MLALAAGALLLGAASAQALRVPGVSRCVVFPASNAWNQRVDALPVAANSAQLVQSIGVDSAMHADFGSGLWYDVGPHLLEGAQGRRMRPFL